MLAQVRSPAALAPDPVRVQTIAGWLTVPLTVPGEPATNRAFWAALATQPGARDCLARAEHALRTPLPETTDDLYLDFSRTGNRTNWERVSSGRRSRLGPLALAECLESRGRFVPPLEATIRAICAEPTWVMPAHDGQLVNFKQQAVTIDLGASHVAADLAVATQLLGDRLSPAIRQLVGEQLARRIRRPLRATLEGRERAAWWLTAPHNWNAVCLANTTIACVLTASNRQEQAYFVAAAETNILHFLGGFTPDGYCSEGLGYWNYGFGHFVLLTEWLRQLTGGRLDLATHPRALAPALFAQRAEIVNGVYPAFADCGVGTTPSPPILRYIAARYGRAITSGIPVSAVTFHGALAESLLYAFPTAWSQAVVPPAARQTASASDSALRTGFPDAGVYVCRPANGREGAFGVAFKGGHNAEFHNHNDVGTYVVVLGRTMVLADPGAEVYTARTFSARRYESRLLSSYGHPVPRVAGRLQEPGAQARATVLANVTTPEQDRFTLDLKAAYAVPTLRNLERQLTYQRQPSAALRVVDHVAFAQPEIFETALITFGACQRADEDSLVIRDGKAAVRVAVNTGGLKWTLQTDTLNEDVRARTKPTRLAILLDQPTTNATITVVIAPEP